MIEKKKNNIFHYFLLLYIQIIYNFNILNYNKMILLFYI